MMRRNPFKTRARKIPIDASIRIDRNGLLGARKIESDWYYRNMPRANLKKVSFEDRHSIFYQPAHHLHLSGQPHFRLRAQLTEALLANLVELRAQGQSGAGARDSSFMLPSHCHVSS